MHVRMPHFQQESTASMFLLLVAVVELVITVAVVVQVAGCLTKPASWCLVLLTSSSGLAALAARRFPARVRVAMAARRRE
jgi:uncharacterized membrane protein YphA (DoxX/SURF4 family)